MREDGILRGYISGNLDDALLSELQVQVLPFLDSSTPENPFHVILFPENVKKVALSSRRYFSEINNHPGMGKIAVVNPPRIMRILGRFIEIASRNENMGFFSEEDEAAAWIKS
jgi:hypothetical protein